MAAFFLCLFGHTRLFFSCVICFCIFLSFSAFCFSDLEFFFSRNGFFFIYPPPVWCWFAKVLSFGSSLPDSCVCPPKTFFTFPSLESTHAHHPVFFFPQRDFLYVPPPRGLSSLLSNTFMATPGFVEKINFFQIHRLSSPRLLFFNYW